MQVISRRFARLASFSTLSLFLLSLDLASAPTFHNIPGILVETLCALLLACSGLKSPFTGTAFFLTITASIFFPPAEAIVTFMALGISAVLALWIHEKRYLLSISCMTLHSALSFLGSTHPKATGLQLVIEAVAAITVGLTIHWGKIRLSEAHRNAQESKEIAQATIYDFQRKTAIDLHDSVATHLVRTILACEEAIQKNGETEVADLLHISLDSARTAMKQLRIIMSDNYFSTETPNTQRTLNECTTLLQTRNITLEIEAIQDADLIRDSPILQLLDRALRELTINILKYAPTSSTASLSIEIQDTSSITVSSINEIAPNQSESLLSSGIGLTALTDIISSRGGSLEAQELSGRWMTSIVIPLNPTEGDPQ